MASSWPKRKKEASLFDLNLDLDHDAKAGQPVLRIYLAIASGRPFMSMEGRCVYVVCSGTE